MKNTNLKQNRPLSYSALKQFNNSPNHLVAYWDRQFVQTPAMLKGSIIHKLILEPDTFNDEYFVLNDADILAELVAGGAKSPKATKIYKEWKAEQLEANQDKTQVDQELFLECFDVSRKALENEILKKVEAVEHLVEFSFAGVPFKGFIDASGPGFILDVKTTSDASPEAFVRDVMKLKYHWQSALYLEANRELGFSGSNPEFYILAVETSSPFNVQLYKMSAEFVDLGFAEVSKAVQRFKDWDGSPAGYEFFDLMFENGVSTLNPPAWAVK